MASNHSIPEQISNVFQESVVDFIRRLVSSYDGLSSEAIVNIWNSDPKTKSLFTIDMDSVKPKLNPKSPSRAKATTSKKSANTSNTTETAPANSTAPATCGYILTKGARVDQPCGMKSRKGGIFCSRHKSHENCKPGAKSIPVASRSSPKKVKSTSEEFNNTTLTFRKHDLIPDCYYHQMTNFVRKSGGGLYVDRKIVDGELVPLTSADVDVCKENQLTICPDLAQKDSPKRSPKISSKVASRIAERKATKSKTETLEPNSIQSLDRVETDVKSAILNMNTEAIAIEAVLRELQVDPRK